MFSYFTKKVEINPNDIIFQELILQLKKEIEELKIENRLLEKKVDHYRQEAIVYKDLIYNNLK
jgi:hypothetical protein